MQFTTIVFKTIQEAVTKIEELQPFGYVSFKLYKENTCWIVEAKG